MARIANEAPIGSMLKLPPAGRSPKYLEAVRQLPCLICRRTPCDAAHVSFGTGRGKGQKASDFRAVPLCHNHHMEQHASGEKCWWDGYQIDVGQLICELVQAFPDVGLMESIVLRYAA